MGKKLWDWDELEKSNRIGRDIKKSETPSGVRACSQGYQCLKQGNMRFFWGLVVSIFSFLCNFSVV